MLPPQMRSNAARRRCRHDRRRTRNPFAGENNILEDRAQFSASSTCNRELQDVFDAANRSNTAIYAVDPRGLATGEFDITRTCRPPDQPAIAALQIAGHAARRWPTKTDGRAIVNRNDLAQGMKQIVRDSSAYYLLGYNSTQAPTDGKFHEIKVRVKRPGVQVRARKGYWALTPRRTSSAPSRRPKPGPAAE